MMNIDIEGGNLPLPYIVDGQEAGSILVKTGNNYTIAAFLPSKEDMEALQAGRPILLKIIGNFIPPISLYTVDEKGESNS